METTGLDAARALLPGVELDAVDRLGASERAVVDRVRATYPDGSRRPLVVKQYQSAGEGWVRESAALAVLPASLHAPKVIASGAEPPVLILEDLGDGSSVADALLGDDPHAAEAALADWARAVARLHTATRSSRVDFRAALAVRQGELPVAESHVGVELDDAVRVLDRECAGLGVAVPPGAFEQLRGLVKRLSGTVLGALTPADTCPDNNVLTTDGLVLVDFEGAQWRHVAWDVAYLRVPWPTCWCSWRIPDDVADRAVRAYVEVAGPHIPEVADAQFARDVEAAVVGWALLTTTWFIGNALGDDPPLNPDRPTPTRRAMLLHRLQVAARTTELPELAELAGGLAGRLRERWGDVPLAFAPAFRADR